MPDTPIKFNSTTEAVKYFAGLGFDEWDAFKLASALWTQQWGANKALEEEKAVADMRAEFPGMFSAVDKYQSGGMSRMDQETDRTGTDLDNLQPNSIQQAAE